MARLTLGALAAATILTIGSAPSLAFEIDQAALLTCSAMTDDKSRLTCFDEVMSASADQDSQSTEAAVSQASPETSNYQPTIRWDFRQISATTAQAYVVTPSNRSWLSLTCNANMRQPWLEIVPENWTANEDVQVVVDDRAFDVIIDGGEGAILSNLPDFAMGIDNELLTALQTGARVSLIGPATRNMADASRIFSLGGSSAAISRVLPYCRG